MIFQENKLANKIDDASWAVVLNVRTQVLESIRKIRNQAPQIFKKTWYFATWRLWLHWGSVCVRVCAHALAIDVIRWYAQQLMCIFGSFCLNFFQNLVIFGPKQHLEATFAVVTKSFATCTERDSLNCKIWTVGDRFYIRKIPQGTRLSGYKNASSEKILRHFIRPGAPRRNVGWQNVLKNANHDDMFKST